MRVIACSSFSTLVSLVVFGLIFSHDIHARFWLGGLPAYALWSSALALGPLLYLLGYGVCLTSYRTSILHSERRLNSMGGHEAWKRFGYVMTARTVSRVCALIVLLAFIAVVLGSGMIYVGLIIRDALMNRCGAEGISYQLEHTHSSLLDFRTECYSNPENDGRPVTFCPGFRDAFPPPSPIVTYLKILEENLECVGFCTKTDGRMFALGAARGASGDGDACGPRLARVLWKVSLLSGVPALVVGCLSGLIACATSHQDEL
jgi:hypothetical protein